MRKHALYKLLVFLCLRPMEMFLNKMAYLKSQGSIKDFQMLTFLVFLAIYIYISENHYWICITLTLPLIGCMNFNLRLLFLDELIQALLQRLKQCVFLTLCNVLCRK